MMPDPLDIFLAEDATPDERHALRQQMEVDEELRRRVVGWSEALQHQQASWEELLPDRRLLVLHALREGGRDDLLSDEDRALLDAGSDRIDAIQLRMTSFSDLKETVVNDCRAFTACWNSHYAVRRAGDRPAARPRSSRASRWLWRLPVAAALVAFAIVAVLVVQRDGEMASIATADGEVRVIEFADGSSIRLLENSRLDYVPDGRQSVVNRRARLEGRALFDIAPQQQGFLVETPVARVTVLGTLFGVDGAERATEVTLVEGRLAFANLLRKEAAVVLEPGQQSRVEGEAMPTAPVDVALDAALDWTGLFIFRGTTLKEIAARLSSHYDVTIDVHQSLETEQLTGTFDQDEPVVAILRALASAVGAQVEETPSRFRILPR